MQTLKFFGIIGLITGIASFTDKNVPAILQCITPIAYNHISLGLPNTKFTIASNVDITITCTQQYIRLYMARSCNLRSLTMKSNISGHFQSKVRYIENLYLSEDRFKSVDISFIEQDRVNFTSEYKITTKYLELDILTLHKGIKLTPGKYSINSTYTCRLEDVAIAFSYINQPLNKTDFLILPRIPAEWIFPYWKNPATKATFTIKVTHKNTDTVVSNTDIKKQNFYSEESLVFTDFTSTPPIFTHSIVLAIIPNSYYISAKLISKDKIIFKSRKQAENNLFYAKSLIQNIYTHIRNTWNKVIPQSRKVTYLILPVNATNYKTVIIEGLVIFSENDIIYDEKVDSIIRRKEVTCLVVRSVIQEMFSNWLATDKQSDLWFVEGFSTVYGVYFHDQHYGMSLLNPIVVQTRREFFEYTETLKYDTSFIAQTSILCKLWQTKAFSTFYMLSVAFSGGFLYTSIFQEAVNLYYNTTSTDSNNELSHFDKFWNNKFENSSDQIAYIEYINHLLTSWTAQVRYPVIQVRRYDDKQYLTLVKIECVIVDQKEEFKRNRWLPVRLHKISTTKILFTYDDMLRIDDNNTIVTWSTSKHNSVIFVNSTGYRVNYDRESWKNIALFLKNGEYTHTELSDVTLAQILDDAFYFLMQNTKYNENPASDDSNVDIYFDLASTLFRVEKSYIAWYPFLTALENMSKNFLFSQSGVTKHIKDRLVTILNKFLDDIHDLFDVYSSENTVSNQLYHEILKWSCVLGSLKCNDHVNATLEWHFTNIAKNKLLPSWQKWIYCQGLMLENVTYDSSVIWQSLLNTYRNQSKHIELFEFLSCSTLHSNILMSFNLLSSSFLPLCTFIRNHKISDRVSLIFDMLAKHSKNTESLTAILQEIEHKVLQRNINVHAIVSCIIDNIYSIQDLSMITDESFLHQLTNIYKMPLFILDAIKVKVENRRRFLVKVQNM
ncbi:aminopeptidase N-like isoform X2 [Pseudomyrmex gracilis]|nr:aminopeptidase N-like isoform X2 [Pseudomyrmex gracilis]